MDSAVRTLRNELFQELKPSCVRLSQLALNFDGSTASLQAVRAATAELLDVLERKCRRTDGVFDEKLADYVFFPLSHVLRECHKNPGLLAEVATKCVRVLLEYGWRKTIAIDLAKQLLLLLTVFAGGGPPTTEISEELRLEAYGCLAALFKDLRSTPKGPATLVEVSTIPALGQALVVVLDGITDGPSTEIQLEALAALESLWMTIKDQQALSTFMPGTISSLTKCLTPKTAAPRSRKVLTRGLQVLQVVLTTVLSDVRTRNLKDSNAEGETLTKSWLKATATQIKLALANVVKLRTHESDLVRQELARLCLVILDECHNSLIDSASMLVETSMMLSSADAAEFGSSTTLKDLATIYPSIAELIKNTVYNWVSSLPRVMQANDEVAKGLALSHLSKAHGLLSGLDMDSTILDDAFAVSLRESVVNLLELPVQSAGVQETAMDESNPSAMLIRQKALVQEYRPLVMPHESQAQTREKLDVLIANIGSSEMQVKMAGYMLENIRISSGNDLLSSFWLSFQLLRAATSNTADLDAFFTPSLTSSDERETLMDELYNYSVSVLASSDTEDLDWRIQAVGLEVVAYSANRLGRAFRPDLIDTLYPVIQLLGSSNDKLREHVIASLNIISESCGYSSTSEMIVQNVDYLVNSLSLKLNTFDISPQAPKMLVMMIRLSGSSLLPYLDDVVGSIFAALDNFHGYPRLVDSLFSVLGEIVDESGRSGQLRLTSGAEITHRKTKPKGPSISDIVEIMDKMRVKAEAREEMEYEEFPKKPWKDAKTLLDEAEAARSGEEKESDSEPGSEVQKAAPTKIYKMVQSIARLSQHYLTSQSPVLRRRLLNLISTACAALHNNEDEFLPLVNDIWPVLIKRLYDTEPFVAIAAAEAIAEVCICAGDFMSTRIQVEWADLMRLVRQSKEKAERENKGKHGRGVFAQSVQVWEGLVKLLCAILEFVRITDEMFDEVLDALAELVGSRADVREALEVVNADAVWLMEVTRVGELGRSVPTMEGYIFASLPSK